MWSHPDLADAVEAGLRRRALRFDAEQAVRGLDGLDEVAIHPILAEALRRADFGVCREQRYPADRRRRRESEGERCDLVLTPDRQPLDAPWREPTLFDPPHPVALDDAFWLEVKVVGQYTSHGPNSRYSAQLLTDAQLDVEKLSRNPGILHAALLIVLFARDEETAEHDLGAWLDHCLRRGLSVRSPSIRVFGLTDRLGNRRCAMGVYPVRPSSPS